MSDLVPITVRLPEDLNEDIEGRLSYGDSRAEWVREACEQKLERDRKQTAEN